MISVLVITQNNEAKLRVCLNSLFNQNYSGEYEIMVVDNASTDNMAEVVKNLQQNHNNLKYAYEKRKGRGYARNKGLKLVKGEIIAFTDDDCTVEPDWLKKIKKRFEEFPNISAVSGAICNGSESKFGWASYLLNFSSWLPSQKFGYVKDSPTANIAYKKQDIGRIQFPESNLNIDYEDTLFNLQLIKRGKKILFDPDIKIYHFFEPLNHTEFIVKQKNKGKSFALRGYKAHGKLGLFLIRNSFILLFCPRITLIFLRCLKSKKFLIQFIKHSSLLIKGEYARGLAVKSIK